MKTIKSKKIDDRSRDFHRDFTRLVKKYPEYVVNAWCPEDFQDMSEEALTADELGTIADILRENFDAGIGINWEVISEAIFAVKEHNQDE
jgi:hypothetical protein